MKTAYWIACAIAFASPMAAVAAPSQYECTFSQECFGTDGCSDTDYALSFSIKGSMAEIVTPYATIEALQIPRGANEDVLAGVMAFEPSGDRHMISVQDGSAWYSVHMPTSDIALFYAGICEAKD